MDNDPNANGINLPRLLAESPARSDFGSDGKSRILSELQTQIHGTPALARSVFACLLQTEGGTSQGEFGQEGQRLAGAARALGTLLKLNAGMGENPFTHADERTRAALDDSPDYWEAVLTGPETRVLVGLAIFSKLVEEAINSGGPGLAA